jgi:hypothetical protein
MIDAALLQERVAAVTERIARAAARVSRPAGDVTLVAVTKTWPAEVVLAAYAAGLRHFGENRPEELAWKRPAVESALGPDSGIVWHLIGTLQSRKTDEAADHADVFHALDRTKIASRLSRRLGENGRRLPVFLEVNVSGEASKSGVACAAWETDATQRAEMRKMVTESRSLPGLDVWGLMTIAPWDAEPDAIRAVFRRTRELAAWLTGDDPERRPLLLSMGMTDDFETAIEEGATHVRVGRALFGERGQ